MVLKMGYQLSNKISKFLAKNSHTQRKYTMSTYTYRVKESQNLILSQVSLAKTIWIFWIFFTFRHVNWIVLFVMTSFDKFNLHQSSIFVTLPWDNPWDTVPEQKHWMHLRTKGRWGTFNFFCFDWILFELFLFQTFNYLSKNIILVN